MEQKKAVVKWKMGREQLLVEVVDVGEDGLLLVTAIVQESDRDRVPRFFESMPVRWRSCDVSDDIVAYETGLFREQLVAEDFEGRGREEAPQMQEVDRWLVEQTEAWLEQAPLRGQPD